MYTQPLYRPPSEASSLIIQLTEGCSHNQCTFCGMYKNKPFRVRSDKEILSHIIYLKSIDPKPDKLFLADGNLLCVKTDKILEQLELVKTHFPTAQRFSCYAGPLDMLTKSRSDLHRIRQAGMDLLYLGVESGSDKILSDICKGVTASEMTLAGQKAIECGFKLSCMVISGLGGQFLSKEHAQETAKVISQINPHYFALLTLHITQDTPLAKDVANGKFQLLTPDEVMLETYDMIKQISLDNCLFRSNHASNYVTLKGVLNKDQDKILSDIQNFLQTKAYTPDYFRSL